MRFTLAPQYFASAGHEVFIFEGQTESESAAA